MIMIQGEKSDTGSSDEDLPFVDLTVPHESQKGVEIQEDGCVCDASTSNNYHYG